MIAILKNIRAMLTLIILKHGHGNICLMSFTKNKEHFSRLISTFVARCLQILTLARSIAEVLSLSWANRPGFHPVETHKDSFYQR